MAALSPDGEGPPVGRRHKRSLPPAEAPRFKGLPDMEAENCVNVFQGTVLYHGKSPLSDFPRLLGGLEQEPNFPRQALFHFREDPRRPQEYGHVGIMTACMHDSRVFRGKGQACLFLYRQSIHVRPKGNCRFFG